MSAASPLTVAVDVRCLVEPGLRGFSRYADELLFALRARSDVRLIGLSDRVVRRDLGFEVELADGSREWSMEQLGMPRLARRVGADVVWCPANRGLPLVGLPSVLTLHDAVEWDPVLVEAPRGRSRIRFGYSNTASLSGATRILTVSDHSARDIAARLGVSPGRIRVVREAPGRHFLRRPRVEDFERVRAAHGLPPRFVLYVGGHDAKKSIETLVRAWGRIQPEHRTTLILAGKRSSETDALLRLAGELGVSSSVRAIGFVDDAELPALYRAAELFVFPAVAEGFGLPPLEAMASGTATVVADAGALPEVVGDAAARFPARDHGALATELTHLLDDIGARTRLAGMGAAHALTRSWDVVASETMDVFREAAGVSAGRRVEESLTSLRSAGRWWR